jgi:hypothetical protein
MYRFILWKQTTISFELKHCQTDKPTADESTDQGANSTIVYISSYFFTCFLHLSILFAGKARVEEPCNRQWAQKFVQTSCIHILTAYQATAAKSAMNARL